MSSPTSTIAPTVAPAGQAECRWLAGSLVEFRLTGGETGGAQMLVELTMPAGEVLPLHVHRDDDETLVVLDGDVLLLLGEEEVHLQRLDVVHIPRNTPHAAKALSAAARLLVAGAPGGHDEMLRKLSRPADARRLPADRGDVTAVSPEAQAAFAAHGVELLDVNPFDQEEE